MDLTFSTKRNLSPCSSETHTFEWMYSYQLLGRALEFIAPKKKILHLKVNKSSIILREICYIKSFFAGAEHPRYIWGLEEMLLLGI